ncbi:hypothetical protein [Herbiconiux sp. UC225_62]|uniref:hypothetical protein n=1 Tax=Herbiconiux sp. UC225_62 TaxID=3350168 RepID=UPI0036D25209
MITAATCVALGTLLALGVLQGLGAAGRPVGDLLWGGRHRVLPRRLRNGSVIAIALYAAFAVILLSRSGAIPGGDVVVVRVLTWVLAAYFVVGIAMNAVSRSPAERRVMIPVCVVLATATILIGLAAG